MNDKQRYAFDNVATTADGIKNVMTATIQRVFPTACGIAIIASARYFMGRPCWVASVSIWRDKNSPIIIHTNQWTRNEKSIAVNVLNEMLYGIGDNDSIPEKIEKQDEILIIRRLVHAAEVAELIFRNPKLKLLDKLPMTTLRNRRIT